MVRPSVVLKHRGKQKPLQTKGKTMKLILISLALTTMFLGYISLAFDSQTMMGFALVPFFLGTALLTITIIEKAKKDLS